MENKIKISCQNCSKLLAVPKGFSGKIACVQCHQVMDVDEVWPAEDWMEKRLKSIDEGIRGIGSAIWMVFFFLPIFMGVIIFLLYI
jgi:phage FluMu protein Com